MSAVRSLPSCEGQVVRTRARASAVAKQPASELGRESRPSGVALNACGFGAACGSDAQPPRRATSVPAGRGIAVGSRGRGSCMPGKCVEGVFRSIRDMQDRGKPSYIQALGEIRNGRKVTHWIWYVWPSLAVLRPGTSRPSFLLPNFRAVQLYLQDDVLSARLVEITEAAISHLQRGLKPQILFGSITDASKFREAMTLFALAALENGDVMQLQLFVEALDRCCRGELEPRAVDAIMAERPRSMKYRDVAFASQLVTLAETGEFSQSSVDDRDHGNRGMRPSLAPVHPSPRAGGRGRGFSSCRPRTPH